MLSCALAVVLGLGTALVADDKKADAIDAKKLVGKWEPKEKKEGTTVVIEFTKDGKVVFTASADGKETKAEGTYKVDGNKLTTMMKFGDMERNATRTVTKLTDTELVSSDDKGKETTLTRVKAK